MIVITVTKNGSRFRMVSNDKRFVDDGIDGPIASLYARMETVASEWLEDLNEKVVFEMGDVK